jgi:uncharacterized protein with von Willebrand factor type A (vWA) domain
VGFGRLLRARGLPATTGRVLTFCRAVAVLAPPDLEQLYWAGRATLTSGPQQVGEFDRAFADWFGPAAAPAANARVRLELDDETRERLASRPGELLAPADQDEPGDADRRMSGAVASAAEALATRDFEDLSEVERRQAAALIRRLRVDLPRRRTRRLRPARSGRRMDLPRTVRRSLRTSGEPLHRTWRERHVKQRPLVLLLDVSGSMAAYSRALAQFGFAAASAGRRVEVFCFGTRLTRVTAALGARDPDAALAGVAAEVLDWGGGTRIGGSVKELLDRWRQHTALRGAVVVLCSDGLDRGDPELLARQMGRLARLAHRIVWVNPLKGDPRYQPLARGMTAALPHVDAFLSGHNLASLRALCRALGELP